MGPITGFRIVNLRVRDNQSGPESRDKVAYPDLTLDLDTGGHVVIGLENGGGKGTLLGFLFHVFAPADRQFLPRLAQRRQRKQGDERRIEQYVPGGSPTHVVVEVAIPARGPAGARGPSKVLLGACLSKPAGAGPAESAEEFFWSARCVADSLDLRSLAIRSGDRLLDHKEWELWLNRMKTAHPDAEIFTETRHRNWERHLSDTLMIDIEFVTSWLLLMNQDEGAADRVFTYGSSREFLNTLVTALANPERINEFHTALTKLSEDADQVEVKRGRKRLLDNLLISSGKTAQHVQELHRLDAGRRGLFDALLATRITMETLTRSLALRYESAREDVLAASEALTAAQESCTVVQLHETQARSQLAGLQLADCTRILDSRKGDREAIKRRVRIAEAAERLADLRTDQAEAQSIKDVFAAKLEKMEPVRLVASSAAQMWKQRVQDELRDLDTERQQQQHRAVSARDLEDAAHARKGTAESTLGGCNTRMRRIRQDLDLITQRIAEATTCGDLAEGQDITEALAATSAVAEELHRRWQQASERSREHQQALDALSEEQHELDTRATRYRSRLDSATGHYQSLVQRGEALAETLRASNLLELDDIDLLKHATIIAELLGHIKHSARTRHLKAELDMASVARTVAALETGQGLLPPRPDVETLCEQATSAKFGARSGWSYLARLPGDIAERYAHQHPDLAAGIVVNIPEDLEGVTELVESSRTHLTGPVVIGPPEAFDNPIELSAIRVVLPDSGFWSVSAAQSQLPRKQREYEQHRQLSQAESDRYDLAVSLQANLTQWSQEAGPATLGEAERALTELTATVNDLAQEEAEFTARREQLLTDRDHAETHARELHDQHSVVKEKERRLAALWQICSTEPDLVAQTTSIDQEIREAQEASQDADTDIDIARRQQRDADERLAAVKARTAELNRDLIDVSDIHDSFVKPGDEITPSDENADLASLEKRAKTAAATWNGSVSDEQLKIKLDLIQEKVRHGRESLAPAFSDVLPDSEQFIADNPALTARDIAARRTELNSELEQANQDVGKMEQARLEKKHTVDATADELKMIGDSHDTPSEYVAHDTARAFEIAYELKELRGDAVEERERAQIRRNSAEAQQRQIEARKGLIDKYDSHFSSMLMQLSAAVPPLEAIDVDDRQFDLDADTALGEGPDELREILSILDDSTEHAIPEDRVDHILDSISQELNNQRRLLTRAAKNTSNAVNVTDAELRNADESVVVGDILLHTLRALPRDELIAHAGHHHHNIEAKLTVVADEVARFDKNLNALSKIAFATVQNLLRSVHQAIKDSELPTTPAMGRWSGLPLLRIAGLDSLTKDQKEAAILSKLQDWFAPDHRGRRPAFDATATVNALIEAVTPRVKAAVLIPSDPLDAQHKPVEQLSMTSGGEGVTVALILASLLASRRSLNHGHRYTTMFLDNPFSKVTKPMFLRLARDVASSLGVRLVLLTGIRDLAALTVFPALIQLRVSHRANANVVLPADIADDRLRDLLHEGTLYVSAIEKHAATANSDAQWPTMSSAEVHWHDQLEIDLTTAADLDGAREAEHE